MKRLFFACIGNAMRSQMAEGLARHLAQPGTVEVRSGGTNPAGYVHPKAVRLMAERGVDISGHASKLIDVAYADRADAFITLCGPMDGACPARVAKKALDWALDDPSWGTDEDVRRIRDEVERRIVELYREWGVLREEHVRART